MTEIQKHNIIITKSDINNPSILRQKIFSIIYYMVKYHAFIVMKDGDVSSHSVILAGTLSNLYDLSYIRALTVGGNDWGTLVLCQEAQINYLNWQHDWNLDKLSNKQVWNDLNQYIPFYIFFDYANNRIGELFKIKFGVNIEDLV